MSKHKKLAKDIVDYFNRRGNWRTLDDGEQILDDEHEQDLYTRARELVDDDIAHHEIGHLIGENEENDDFI